MRSQGESWTEVGPDSAVLHIARLFRLGAHAEALGAGRAHRPPTAAVAHMVDESIKRNGPVCWD
jgi:hypothetical protein